MEPALIAQTLAPAILAGLCMLLERSQRWQALPRAARQAIVGVLFGALACAATETGVPVVDGGVVNVRDAAPLVAGLAFGAPAGIIAGVIGAIERWLCVYWGGGMTTRLACSLGTLVAGLGGAAMRRYVFDNERPAFLPAAAVGVTTEVIHMLLVLLTNMDNLTVAFAYVEACSSLMIGLNGLACGLALIGQSVLRHEQLRVSPPHLINDLAARLVAIIFVAFLAMTNFTLQVATELVGTAPQQGIDIVKVMLYLTVFMEIIVHTALFIVLYQLMRRRVVGNLVNVEQGLDSIAKGDLDTQVDVRTHQEFSRLSDDINTTVGALKGYIDEAEHRRDAELEMARQIQRSALPSVFPPFPERADFDLFASMDAAREVGGDFYDFFLLNSHTLVFLIADVSGKGVPAALFMMEAKSQVHSLMESGLSPADALTEANRRLCETNELGMFVTVWLGKLDLTTGVVSYANAGHNPPLVSHADGTWDYVRQARPNFVLAGMEGIRYRAHTLELGPGDRLYLYTDGVTEAANPASELYGEQRLVDELNASAADTPQAVCEGVLASVRAFADGAEQSDDITMLAIDVAALRGRDQIVTRADLDSIELVRALFEERLPKLGANARTMRRVLVAVDEGYSNICRYSGATRAVASIMRDRDGILVEFADNGAAFDPTAVPEPDTTLPPEERAIGGLGIHMMRRMSRRMEYARVDETNLFSLTFDING